MGKIQRQGVSTSIFLYLGLILGMINTGLLFPVILPKEVFGFAQFLVRTSGLLSAFSLLGLPLVGIRFFPAFRDKAGKHGGFFAFLLLLGLGGTAIMALGMAVFDEQIIQLFTTDNSNNREDIALSNRLVREFYWGLLIWFITNNIVVLLANYATALQRPRVPTFFMEVVGRLITLGLLLLYFYKVIDADLFVSLYSLKPVPIILGLILFLMLIGELHLHYNRRIWKRPEMPEIFRYLGFAAFASIGTKLTVSIDTIMIAGMLGQGEVGVYAPFALIATVIVISHNGVAKIANPLISEYWEAQRLDKIQDLYRRMALNNLVPAVLVFIGIMANLDNAILHYGPDYAAGRRVALFLGLAQILHVLNGYNGLILVHSPRYRYDLYFKLLTAIITVITNLIFVRSYGVVGAAIATAMTILLTNSVNQLFLYRSYGIHPFSRPMVLVVLLGAGTLAVVQLIPQLPTHYFMDALLRSALIVLVYGVLVYQLRISNDINQYLRKVYARLVRGLRG